MLVINDGPKYNKCGVNTPYNGVNILGVIMMEKKQVIIEAAARIFSVKSFNGTTTREIAQEAGIPEGTIFRYFKNKKDILYHILLYAIDSVVPQLAVVPLETIFSDCEGKTPEEILKLVLLNRWEIISQNFTMMKVLFSEMQFHDDLRQIYKEKVYLPMVKLIEQYIQNGINTGIFREVDVSTTAKMVMGMFVILPFTQFINHENKLDNNEETAKMINLLFFGIKNTQL